MKKIVSFIVPTLNEERNIKDTIDTIERNMPCEKLDYEIIVVDGGSVDRTVEIVNSIAKENGKVRINAEGNIKGLGHAYKRGVYLAVGDYIIMIPGDNEVSGEAINTIVKMAGEADMIIPYFVNQEIRTKSRQFISKAYVYLLNFVFGLNLHYYNGTVLHRSEVLKGYNITTSGFAYQAEILINLIKSGFTYQEVATKIQERSSGKTKIFKISNIFSVLYSLLDLFWEHRIKVLFGKKKYNKHVSSLSETTTEVKKKLPDLDIPDGINYVAVFLTFACNLNCSYCINNYEKGILKRGNMDGEKWVSVLNRLRLRHDLPVTLQGGEPSVHRDFYYIINNLRPDIEIDILTNLFFDVEEFIEKVDPKRINRNDKYQSIRASYHPESMDIEATVKKVKRLQDAGFNICLSSVDHPDNASAIANARKIAEEAGIIYFTKDYLGFYNNQLFGKYKYPEAVTSNMKKNVQCRTTELLIGPTGEIYKCTRDVYVDSEPIGNILDPNLKIEYKHRYCRNFGYCNPCDIKIKTNRFMEDGHTSVDIKFIEN